MKTMNRRQILALAAGGVAAGGALLSRGCSLPDQEEGPVAADLQKGREFLNRMIDPELDLLPEYIGSNIYWLYHDNYLAAKVLRQSYPETSNRIEAAIQREGVSQSGKIELLFGELTQPLPFRQHELIDVRTVGTKTIRTEVLKETLSEGWQSYADLRLMAAIAEPDKVIARTHWQAAIRMWDGKGFADDATKVLQRYSTYKLGIALIASNRLGVTPPRGLKQRLRSLQTQVGGWVTDYGVDGQPVGLVNVETTCLSILGLEGHIPSR